MRYCRWRSRSRDRNCPTAKIYADLEAAKEVQSKQAVHLGRWRKGVREDGEIVDGFAEGFKPLHCNARTEFDPAPQLSPEFGEAMLLGRIPRGS